MDIKSLIYHRLVLPINVTVDKIKGLDFLTEVQSEQMNLDPNRVYASSPSTRRFLKELFDDFKISQRDAIIDIGCGKGNAMLTMLKYPFGKVDGVELCPKIAAIANKNFLRLRLNKCKIFTGDATQFKEYDSYNFIYFYNPFPSFVMKQVIDLLIDSQQRTNKEVVIIYLNPTCHDVIVKTGVFKNIGVYYRRANWVAIYSNRTIKDSITSNNRAMHRIVDGSPWDQALKAYVKDARAIHSDNFVLD